MPGDRVAIVTGANRPNGIGFALVSELRRRDYSQIVATYRIVRHSAALLSLAAHDETVCAVQLNVADASSVEEFARKLTRDGVQVDVLVNNAGRPAPSVRATEAHVEELEEHLQVHAVGMFRLTQAVLPAMHAGTVVVNVSSTLGAIRNIGAGYTFYAPAKALENALTRQLAACVREAGITVVAVHPGWVATEIGGAGAPVSPGVSAHGIARLIDCVSLIDSGTFRDYCGRPLEF